MIPAYLLDEPLLDICRLNVTKGPRMKATNKKIELDWNKLLGFNQVKAAQAQTDAERSRAIISSKVGVKVGAKGGGGGGGG
jgi:hypothetical protein